MEFAVSLAIGVLFGLLAGFVSNEFDVPPVLTTLVALCLTLITNYVLLY